MTGSRASLYVSFSADSVQRLTHRCTQCTEAHIASIQRIVSPLTKDVSYRAQVRVKGRSSESATFPNRKEAEAWAASIETAIRERRHFPHAAAKRISFDALAKDNAETVLVEFDEVQCAARTLQLNWWSKQFAGKSVAEITADAVSKARDACGACVKGASCRARPTALITAPSLRTSCRDALASIQPCTPGQAISPTLPLAKVGCIWR